MSKMLLLRHTKYNTICEIEYSFRTLKTGLNLRPICHKKDESTMAHLHWGLFACWVVNTVQYQLKEQATNFQWSEIVRMMNTQKAVTTVSQNRYDEVGNHQHPLLRPNIKSSGNL
jgi:hypothetical protein